jgi:hypothetical protein
MEKKPKIDLSRYAIYHLLHQKLKNDDSSKRLLFFLLTLFKDVEDNLSVDLTHENESNMIDVVKSNLEKSRVLLNELLETTFIKNKSRYLDLYNEISESRHDIKIYSKLVGFATEISEKLFEFNRYIVSDKVSIKNEKMNQVFLSYAHADKLYTLGLYYLFLDYKVFLYVDWMNNGIISDAMVLKKTLDEALKQSIQLLFLRSTNSELSLQGYSNIRQWCSWEIGNFYCKNPDEKFYTVVFDDQIKPSSQINLMLSTFKPLHHIVKERMV